MSDPRLTQAAGLLKQGRVDEAIAFLESLADQSIVGSGVAYDRGLAYALRARSGRGLPGDLGRAAHAFEEALRLDPHDAQARSALDEVRREIARRDAQASGKAEEVSATPMWRALVTAAPGNAWASAAIAASVVLAVALAVRPRLVRGRRLAASTIAVVALATCVTASGLALGARWLRTHVREAVVVAPHAIATRDDGTASLDLDEGTRVDVVEERATTTQVKTEKGAGFVPRDAVRLLPPYRP